MDKKSVYTFMIAGFVIFFGLVAAAAYRQGWFSSTNQYSVKFESGEGLFVGAPVSISGLKVGVVDSVELDSQNKIEVKVRIQRKFADHIREDSHAVLGRPFIIGEKAISITPGSPEKKILPAHSKIIGEESLEITDMLSGGRLGPYFATFSKLLDQIRLVVEGDGTDKTVNLVSLYRQAYSSLKAIDSVSHEISGLRKDVTGVAVSPEMKKIFYGVANSTEDIQSLLKETQKTMPAVLKLSDNLVHMMPALTKTLNETVFTLQALQRSFILSGGVRSLKSEIKEAKEKGTALPESEQVIERSPASEAPANP